jgi:hypothetical protein
MNISDKIFTNSFSQKSIDIPDIMHVHKPSLVASLVASPQPGVSSREHVAQGDCMHPCLVKTSSTKADDNLTLTL